MTVGTVVLHLLTSSSAIALDLSSTSSAHKQTLTMVKSIILMRHAEREDRAQEMQGLDWISTAPRPQDPQLSAGGTIQSQNL